MTKQVFTIGYVGLQYEQILELVTEHNAVLFDIRFNAYSRAAKWRKASLMEYFDERYRHLNEFGNADYKSGGMRIANYDAGKKAVEESEYPVILMCGCKDPAECHRTVVGEMLTRDGYTVAEHTFGKAGSKSSSLTFGQDDKKKGPTQGLLFDQ